MTAIHEETTATPSTKIHLKYPTSNISDLKMLSVKPATPPSSTVPSPQPYPAAPTFPPFHPIPGVSNFRDIGGWPITSPSTAPKHVRKGLIFRGGDTTRITPTGISKLQDLNVKTDCDLRSKQQIEKAGRFKDLGEWGITRIWSPVFGEEEYTEEKARARYEYYASEDTAVSRVFFSPVMGFSVQHCRH